VVRADPGEDDGSIRLLNTCFAYSSAGAVVRKRWPQLYTGDQPAEGALAKEDASAD
jgi:hypothetical protein